jgi:hypothetical protein
LTDQRQGEGEQKAHLANCVVQHELLFHTVIVYKNKHES